MRQQRILVKQWEGRRVVLAHGRVAVGTVTADDDRKLTGVRFEKDGAETVRFAMSDEARDALIALLTDPSAGERWNMPADATEQIVVEWRLVPLPDEAPKGDTAGE